MSSGTMYTRSISEKTTFSGRWNRQHFERIERLGSERSPRGSPLAHVQRDTLSQSSLRSAAYLSTALLAVMPSQPPMAYRYPSVSSRQTPVRGLLSGAISTLQTSVCGSYLRGRERDGCRESNLTSTDTRDVILVVLCVLGPCHF